MNTVPGDEITLTFTLEPSDYLMRKVAFWRWVRVFLLSVLIAAFVVAVLLYVSQRGDVDWAASASAFGIAVAVVGFFAIVWAANALLTAPRRMQERFAKSPSLLRPHTIVTAEEGVYVTTEETELLLKWRLITSARVTARMLLLYHAKEVLVAIPFRAFVDDEQTALFLKQLNDHNVQLHPPVGAQN